MRKDTFQLLHSLPSVTEGMARLLDLSERGVDDGYVMTGTGKEADARSIASDWSVVMGDMHRSAPTIGKSSKA